jgi:hypothetical protein
VFVIAGLIMALGGCAKPGFVGDIPPRTSTPTAPDPVQTFPAGEGAPKVSRTPEKKALRRFGDGGAGRIRHQPRSSNTVSGNKRGLVSAVPLRQSRLQRTAAPEISNPRAPTDEQQFARVEELLRNGDIAGARLYLEHLGAAVAFRLAETYDPERLAAWQAVGIPADPMKARELYERALAGGVIEAQERLDRLPH